MEMWTDSAEVALKHAEEQASFLSHHTLSNEHILLGLVMEHQGVAGQILRYLGVTPENVIEEINRSSFNNGMQEFKDNFYYLSFSPGAKETVERSRIKAHRLGATQVGTTHLLLGMIENGENNGTKVLSRLGINTGKLADLIYEKMGVEQGKFSKGPRGRAKSKKTVSNTPTLDSVAKDMTAVAREDNLDPVIGRSSEINRTLQILSRRNKNNAVLVGNPGVGKTAVAEGVAQLLISPDVPSDLKNKRLMALEMGSLVAGTKYRGEFEDRLKKIVDEISEDHNTILFIDEIHTLIGAGGAEGAIDASNILKPALARGDIQIIGATTFNEYQKYIEKDAALERRFAQVKIDEPTTEDAKEILKGLKERYENYHNVSISDDIIEETVELSTRYMPSRFLPDKAIDIIDEAASKVKLAAHRKMTNQTEKTEQNSDNFSRLKEEALEQQDYDKAAKYRTLEIDALMREQKKSENDEKNAKRIGTVKLADIQKVIFEWTGIPVKQLKSREAKRMAKIENVLTKSIVGQDKAVNTVAQALKRSASGLKAPNQPIGTFMFLGPTGVGKTQLAKAVAEEMFGSSDQIIRIDMSEYMESFTTSKLIGSAPGYVGYEEGGQLTEQVRQKPYSVILLDEMEKANPQVFNLFLQILDEGFVTDGKGRKVDFRNTIIIMTSNLGATALRDDKTLGFNTVNADINEANEQRVMEVLKRTDRPEFLNRIDEKIVFNDLGAKDLRRIANLLIKDTIKLLDHKEISADIKSSALDIIAKKGYEPGLGARPMKRVIKSLIENPLSNMLLNGEIVAGDEILINGRNGEINITRKVPEIKQTTTKTKTKA